MDLDGSHQDIAIDYRDDVGMQQQYITWWGRTYPRPIFLADFPRGNPRPQRQTGDGEGPNTFEEGSDGQADDAREQEASGDEDDPDAGEGDQDGDDEEDEEEVKEEDKEDKEEDKEENEENKEEDESDVVPHHSGDYTIALDPLSLPS
ncbi:histone H2A.Z-specific chaperone CHZ1-like [Cryptomeria japonica]|uniref:histone H2A.Z-specific chaperone CHZ1-like n=1 Tax=Cryptomeria japonica TaxID=3369 RepID=UPI0027DA715D|nr:histone H2A.Z-specific chaperone CHZ1-like [Cryptomeria japonica]